MLKADLVVVGGGPGGSSAAEAALQADPDLRVVVLEQRGRPHGTCAGGVGFNWLEEMNLTLPEHLVETPIDEVVIHGPSSEARIHRKQLGVNALGFVIDRWGFDEWLLSRAIALGANVLRETTFTDIHRADGGWLVEAKNASGEFGIEARYVVDASGPRAIVGKRLGLKINERPTDIHVGLQWTVPLPETVPMSQLDMWFKRDHSRDSPWACRSGYVWSFPTRHPYWDGSNPVKAGRYTRLGIGVEQANNAIPERSAKRCLEDFRACYPDFAGEIVSENGGLIPTGLPLDTGWENVFLAGDSGRHVSPLHGGGIWFARVAGEEAGRVVARGGSGADYVAAWEKRIGWTLKAHYALKQLIYALDNEEMDILVQELGKYRVESANPIREIPKAAAMIARHPRLSGKMAIRGFLGLLKSATA